MATPTPVLESNPGQIAAKTNRPRRAQGNTSELRPIDEADHFSVIHGLENPDSEVAQWLARMLGALGRK